MIISSNKLGDYVHKSIIKRILYNGSMDKNPRPKYKDGTPAHTKSINHVCYTYDLSKGELPLITLRYIAWKNAVKEILWIYQDQTSDLNVLRNQYGINWWDEWDIGDNSIGSCYGHTVKRYNLIDNLIKGLKEDPDGRRHIMNLWQEDEFKEPHGLKPCCYQTVWNVRYDENDEAYLDMCLFQRSSDYLTAGVINQIQYIVLQYMIAQVTGYKVGKFTWMCANVQIYDRHFDQAEELLKRYPISEINPKIVLNPNIKDFYDFRIDDIKIEDYDKSIINEINPQLKFDIGI